MRDLLVVLPGGLAMRRLSELLALKAAETGAILYPPQIVTVGNLPEKLYVAKLPFASDLVQQLSWMQVLRETPTSQLEHLIPAAPHENLHGQWLELGKVLRSLHRELASDRHNFLDVAEMLGQHPDRTRWDVLADIQQRYLALLDSMQLWDIQTARQCALEFGEARTTSRILVVGCVDLNRTQRGFLEAVRSQTEVWIAAPASCKDLFDDLGCLHSSKWKEQTLEIRSEQLYVGNSPSDQAELTASCVAELGDDFHARELTIGVADSALIPELQRRLDQSGVTARYGPGTAIGQSEVVSLLISISNYLESRSYVAFAKLIRHPAIENIIRTQKKRVPDTWLTLIDQYYQAALPKRIDGFVNEEVAGAKVFEVVSKTVDRWLAKLGSKQKRIADFVQPLLNVLTIAFDKQQCDLEDAQQSKRFAAANKVAAAILELRDIPLDLQPQLNPTEVIDWLVNHTSSELVAEVPNPQSVEMLGWLELVFDDAPALIVTGMHDGVVPESVNSDAFLPNSLRVQLGMMDNDRRFARDLYALRVSLESRKTTKIVVGRKDANGDPLVPSRLLMACDLEQLPGRVLHLVDEQQTDVPIPCKRNLPRSESPSQLTIPKPVASKPITRISVTAFRDYLRCPYRFYLGHVLRLRSEQDELSEMNAPQFGNLIHDTLALLEGDIGRSDKEEEVGDFLISELHNLASEIFGPNPAPAVLIQIEQAELRLRGFAAQQAARAAEGWEIRYLETGVDAKDAVKIGHDGELNLIGRIDRIDYHPATDRWAIWDYKTSETAKSPVKVHWTKQNGWADLQLPLYRHIAAAMGITGQPSVGYISLPKQASDSGFFEAHFSAEQFEEADQLSNDVASSVAAQEFWPEKIEDVDFDDFARLCQTQTQSVSAALPLVIPHRTYESVSPSLTPEVVEEAAKLVANPAKSSPSLNPLLIRASAGTGKTFQLTNRLLAILLSGQDVDHILATTFTRKAAGEITERVLQRLAKACIDEDARAELESCLAGTLVSQANCLATLRRVTISLHRLRISTLDSFFAQVARAFSFEMALPPGWNAMDPVQEPHFQLQAIGSMLENHDRKKLVDLVRMLAKGESQRQVSEEIRRTVASGYGPYRATSAEAWDQLPLPKPPSEQATESALLTLSGTKLNHKSADAQLEKLHLLASMGDWEQVINHGVYGNLQADPPTYYRRELTADLIVALEVLIERSAAELLPIRRNQTLASYAVLDAFDKEYLALVRRFRMLAFSDITYYLSRWMAGEVDMAVPQNQRQRQLEFRLDCGVHHLLLDEFQDTAPEQWNILEPLATPLGDAEDSTKSILCVGDTKQAIYGWRGGVAEIFDSVQKSIPTIEEAELRESYRSSPRVIEAVNDVFQNLTDHSNFNDCNSIAKSWSDRFPEHATAKKSLPGYIRLENGPNVDSDLPLEDRKLEFLRHTAQQIADLTKETGANIGVLFRANRDVARMIALLRDLGVSASQDGGNPLTDSAAVELICSLIHLGDHPGDSISQYHIASSPLASFLPHQDPIELSHWLRQTVHQTGLGATIANIADLLLPYLHWWDQHRVEQLVSLAYDFQNSIGGRLREFESAVEAQKISLPTESQVKVMTVHKSKGLEFDAVFLPELEIELVGSSSMLVLRGKDPCEPPDGVLRYMNSSLQSVLPVSWQKAFEQHKQGIAVESLCLLYVAMTRAKQALYMTTRAARGGSSQQLGSLLQSVLGTVAGTKKLRSEVGAVMYEKGESDWYLPASQASGKSASANSIDGAAAEDDSLSDPRLPLNMEITLRSDLESAPTRGLRVTAPSTVGSSQEPVLLSSAFSYSHNVNAAYGSLIHAFFEQVRWLEDFELDRDVLRKVAQTAISPEELQLISLEDAMDEFEEMLSLGSVKLALSKGRYHSGQFGIHPDSVEIDNERILNVLANEQLVAGAIDRLAVLMKDGQPYAAEIIDFKTDNFDPTMTLLWLEDRIEHHRPQLEVYAQTIAKLFRIPRDRVSAHLVMLSTDDFVRADQPTALQST